MQHGTAAHAALTSLNEVSGGLQSGTPNLGSSRRILSGPPMPVDSHVAFIKSRRPRPNWHKPVRARARQ